jgi:hypothetical protein
VAVLLFDVRRGSTNRRMTVDQQRKEGLSLSCHPGRGLARDNTVMFTLTIVCEINRGVTKSPPSGIGPWHGARVAPQHCPILRPGQLERRHKEVRVATDDNRSTQKEDISKEFRTRTFLKSCDTSLFRTSLFRTSLFRKSARRVFARAEVGGGARICERNHAVFYSHAWVTRAN